MCAGRLVDHDRPSFHQGTDIVSVKESGMRHLALLAGLVVAACASDGTSMKTMVGTDESTQVAAMGRPPDTSVETRAWHQAPAMAPASDHLQSDAGLHLFRRNDQTAPAFANGDGAMPHRVDGRARRRHRLPRGRPLPCSIANQPSPRWSRSRLRHRSGETHRRSEAWPGGFWSPMMRLPMRKKSSRMDLSVTQTGT